MSTFSILKQQNENIVSLEGDNTMTTIFKTITAATLAIALLTVAVTITTTPAEAGPKFSTKIKTVSGLDLGSGR